MDRNEKIIAIVTWANDHEINLDHAEIEPTYNKYDFEKHRNVVMSRLTFNHEHETAANMRLVKRAVSFDQEHKGDSDLCGHPQDFPSLRVRYIGAFECEVTHHCKPKGWKPEQLSDDEGNIEESGF